MIPSWTKALAWLAMFRNSTSGANGFLAGLGIPVPDWLAYGPIAIVLCMSMHYYAFSYIMVSGALRSINSELEAVSYTHLMYRVLRSGHWKSCVSETGLRSCY